MFGLSTSGSRKIQIAWERAVVDSTTEVLRHLPLIVGGTATALVHLARITLLPDDGRLWVLLVDGTLIVAELLFGISLALGNGLDLVGELAERLTVSIHRVREAWRTGRRPPERPQL